MAVPSRRHKAGAREIKNREAEQSEQRKKDEAKEEISKEEHQRRVEELKKLGLIK